ncbi:unnamed protein product [Cuscuta europaea]|uniref:DDE Tnp4 domain-containing protein n=1 Tax=Cuscuta europaea TaxID=41803 RepID=A0A9P1ECE7_CUSEU|nr:unnamed protein product [Cuscuta europaea]
MVFMANYDMRSRQFLLLFQQQYILCQQYFEIESENLDMMTSMAAYMCDYYFKNLYKEPCMTSYLTGERWMDEILNGHGKRCFNAFRMTQNTFRNLCADLETKYGLRPSSRVSVLEKVGLFVYVLSKSASNRDTQERFQHSGETVSRIFKEVLNAMDELCRDILVPKDPDFKRIPSQIANDDRYMPHFKDCIGAIDGTHIVITVPEEDQIRYRGRKGIPTTNVLTVCDFDLLFTYVLTGWEGSAHDSRIFLDTLNNSNLNFPNPPPGKYYLVDKGYPERYGYLTPYPKTRYHQSEFRGSRPRGSREVFNRAHSSLRSCIERAFGVLKARWKILQKMPNYSLVDQNRIICSCFALHNYIRKSKLDPAFDFIDEDPEFIPPDVIPDVQASTTQVDDGMRNHQMTIIRDSIASSLMS